MGADTTGMAEPTIADLRAELAELELEAARLSATRSRLHNQIDFGFETTTTRERERQVSDERQELHRRIDQLRDKLATSNGA